MSLDRSIAKNTIIQVIGRLLTTAAGLVVLAVMTRSLGEENFGKYATITAFLQFASTIIDFGLTLTANRLLGESLSKEEDGRIMGNIMAIRILSAVAALGIAPLIALLFLPYPHDVDLGIAITAVSFLAIGLTQTLIPIFQKHLRLERNTIADLIGRAVLMVGVLIAAYLHAPLTAYLVIIVCGSIATYFVTRAFAQRITPYHLHFDREMWQRIFTTSWPIAVSIVFNLIYLRTDVLLLSIFRSNDLSEVGFYGAAYRVLDILTGISTAFMGIMLPLLTAAWVGKRHDEFRSLTQKSFNVFALLGVPTVAAGVTLGRPLMVLVAGKRFEHAGDILSVLILAMACVYFSTLFGHLIVVIDKQRRMIAGYALGAVVGLTAYIILIPRYGVWGGAWATVGTELLVLFITAWLFQKTAHPELQWDFFGKAVLAGLPMAAIFFIWRQVPVLIPLTTGLLAYVAMLFVTKAVSKQFIFGLIRPK